MTKNFNNKHFYLLLGLMFLNLQSIAQISSEDAQLTTEGTIFGTIDPDIYCGTKYDYPNFLKNLASCDYGYDNFEDVLEIRTHLHIIRESNGTGGRNLADVNQAIDNLKNVFNPYGIDFLIAETNYIDNTSTYESSFFGCITLENENCPYYKHSTNCSALDIFILDDDTPSWNGGISNGIPSLAVIVGGVINNEDVLLSNILAHEVGHALGLFHTHHGTCEGDETRDLEICEELVDGTNCCDCGDFVCDTDASPRLDLSATICTPPQQVSSCNSVDANGMPFNPQENNIMSYNPPFCITEFTWEQATRMRYHIEKHPVVRRALTSGPGQNTDPPSILAGLNIWTEDYVIRDQDLIVPTGSTLIIEDAFLRFANAGIIVEQKARLIIRGQSILTRYDCQQDYWTGIRVLGNPAIAHPDPISSDPNVLYSDHGILEISEYANIEFAQVGARSFEDTGSGSWRGAGVIRLNEAQFRRCHNSVLLGWQANSNHLIESSTFYNNRASSIPTVLSSNSSTYDIGGEIRQVQLNNINDVTIESCMFNPLQGGFTFIPFPNTNVNSHIIGVYSANSDITLINSFFNLQYLNVDIYDNYGSNINIEGRDTLLHIMVCFQQTIII